MFRQVLEWLLNKGLLMAMVIVNAIAYVVLAIAMFILHWYHKNH